MIVYTNHTTLKYLLSKNDVMPWLIWWILLWQEFDLEIQNKKREENIITNHLSQIEKDKYEVTDDKLPIDEIFPNEKLMMRTK